MAAVLGWKVRLPIASQMQSIIGRALPLLRTMIRLCLGAKPIRSGLVFKFELKAISEYYQLAVGVQGGYNGESGRDLWFSLQEALSWL